MNFFDANFFLHVFWLVPLCLLVLYIGACRRLRRVAAFVESRELAASLTGNVSSAKRRCRDLLFFAGLMLLIIAAARPYWGTKLIQRPAQTRDILILMDTSRSMLATDIPPSRLKHARWFVRNLVVQTPGDRYGLIAFAGTAFLECPLTQDRNGFLLFLDDISTDTMPVGGTNIEVALKAAMEAFKAAEGRHRAVILITDGDELDGDATSVLEDFKKRRIPIFVVGIGDPVIGSFIQIEGNKFVTDEKGERVQTKLDEAGLKRISAAVGGTYVHSTVVHDGLKPILAKIRGLVPEQQEENTVSRAIERYQIPLFLAVLCFLARMMIGERNSRRSAAVTGIVSASARSVQTAVCLMAVALSMTGSTLRAQDAAAEADAAPPILFDPKMIPSDNVPPEAAQQQPAAPGQQAQGPTLKEAKEKLLRDSITGLKERIESAGDDADPRELALWNYNLGWNYQKLGHVEPAEQAYEAALDTADGLDQLTAAAYQNLGVMKHAEAFQQAMVDPDKALAGLSDAQAHYREGMRADLDTEGIGKNQELVVMHREMIEEFKKIQEQLQQKQQDAQECTKEALENQQEANKESDPEQKQEKQQQAQEKTEKAEEATRNFSDAARDHGQEQAADMIDQTAEKLEDAQEKQEKAASMEKKEEERESAGEQAEEDLKQALQQLGGQLQEEEPEGEGKKQVAEGEKGEEEPEDESEQGAAAEEPPEEPETDPKAEMAEAQEGEETEDFDKMQAMRILEEMQQQERDLKQALKEEIKRNARQKPVRRDW